MRWSDDGIFLSGRPHGETSVIADIFTRDHGRTLGLVKGGRSRRIRPLLQAANCLKVEWRARLDEQLGVYTVELADATAARVLDDRLALSGITSIAALLRVLPERDPHPRLFEATQQCLAAAEKPDFPAQIVRFELLMLDELGFGLELGKCAVTGRGNDLAYVSPRSGQAVARAAGEPYREKLLPLPAFLLEEAGGHGIPNIEDVACGLKLTGFFMKAHIFGEDAALPAAREAFAAAIFRHAMQP